MDSKRVKWWQVVIGLAVAAVVTVAVIWGVNAIRANQAAQAEAAEQAEIVAAQQAEVEALIVKFAAPAVAEIVKAPPPEVVVEAPVAEDPVADEPPADAGPVLCPPGSTANSSDGYNDTSCYPDECFSIAVPDPAYPQCDVAFIP